jgi:hypothetical protein
MTRCTRVALLAALAALGVACGGGGGSTLAGNSASSSGGGSPSGSNVVTAIIDAGPANNSDDMLFTTVTVCAPGSTTNCQTVDHVQVDTGSSGLRILASLIPASVTLPAQPAPDGNALVECFQYIDGFNWGPIVKADVSIGGETASSVPIQLIGSTTFPTVPPDCSSTGPAEDTVTTLAANGILGVSTLIQDCGPACASAGITGAYYSCTTSECRDIAVPLASQVVNPITLFATDNNGLIIELPPVPAQGAGTATGNLVFGIDTQANNQTSNQAVIPVGNPSGYITAMFNGQTLPDSFIDSGSNGLFFTDTSIVQCTGSLSGYYCPASPISLSAGLEEAGGALATYSFTVDNAQTLFDTSFTVFATIGGTNSDPASFDFGLPFYLGRDVYHVIQGDTTSLGTGPFIAF